MPATVLAMTGTTLDIQAMIEVAIKPLPNQMTTKGATVMIGTA